MNIQSAVVILGAISLQFGGAQAVTFHTGDGSIDGSLCVGFDCIASESFGSDTLRLKENNLRIHFDDTSNSASFPDNDWRITINDSGNGEGNYFSIDDATSGRKIFRLDAGAPANSLRVDSQGDVGFGTGTPVTELHVTDGDTPTMRLEQDGSSGFNVQTWDLAGNEANFFIRDVTNGSSLVFRLKPGAPENSIYVNGNGDVGLGTSGPGGFFHARRGGIGLSILESSDNNAVQYRLKSNSTNRRIVAVDSADGVKSQLIFSDDGVKFSGQTDTSNISTFFIGDAVQMRFVSNNASNRRLVATSTSNSVQSQILLGNGQIQLAGANVGSGLFATINSAGLVLQGSSITVNGTSLNIPDYVFDENYELMPLDAVKSYINKNKHLPEIQPASYLAENGVDMTEMQLSLLKKVEELTLYLIAQQEQIANLQTKISSLKETTGAGN